MSAKQPPKKQSGKLRIGDDWNAITVIALSQQSPLKAVAELVENSIDAHAVNIIITRGKEKGQPYLRIMDDGEGVETIIKLRECCPQTPVIAISGNPLYLAHARKLGATMALLKPFTKKELFDAFGEVLFANKRASA